MTWPAEVSEVATVLAASAVAAAEQELELKSSSLTSSLRVVLDLPLRAVEVVSATSELLLGGARWQVHAQERLQDGHGSVLLLLPRDGGDAVVPLTHIAEH
jgi:hypothetical protein